MRKTAQLCNFRCLCTDVKGMLFAFELALWVRGPQMLPPKQAIAVNKALDAEENRAKVTASDYKFAS